MGNHFSKKTKDYHTTSNYHKIFSSRKLLSENKINYDEREALSNGLSREIFGEICSAPIKDKILKDVNAKILDVGCGSGFWLMELAADFPKPSYVGVEMLPIFPKSTIPRNVEFIQCDFLKGLPYEDNTFDYIHLRSLAYDLTESQWENIVYQELGRVLKPGGWLEVCDFEFRFINPGPKSGCLSNAVNEYLISKGVNPNIVLRQESLIKSIPPFSSTNVYHKVRPLYLSSHTNVGKFGALHVKEHCRSIIRGPVGQTMGIKQKEIDSTIREIGVEFDSCKTYLNYYRYYVQKQR